jgi:tetratricopeptide (TPR) repeat protein
MFEKIKQRLNKIEDKSYKEEDIKEELEKILKTIIQVKREITELEEKTKSLLEQGGSDNEKDEGQGDMTGFISGIQSARVNVETLLDRGWNYIVSGKYKEAIKELLRARQMDQRNVQIFNLIGWAYIKMEQYDKANSTFQDALRIDGENEMAHTNMGFLKYKKGQYAEALKSLSNISKNAKNKQAVLYALFYLGLIYYEREMFNDAIELLNEAIAQGPNLYEAYYYLGMAYKKRGLNNMAIQIWKRLIDINQYNIWAKKAVEALDGQ